MATPALLDEFLRSGEQNLLLKLSDWFKTVHSEKLFVNVRFTPHGASNMKLNAEPLELNRRPEGLSNFVDHVEELIREKLGPSPFGVIRVQGYEPRHSAHPSFDMTRTLIPEEAAGLAEPNIAVYRSVNADLQRRVHQLEGNIVQVTNSLAVALGATSQSLQAAATLRTASTASNELSGIGPLVSLGAIILLYPQIKDFLGLPSDAPLADVIKAGQMAITGALGPPAANGSPAGGKAPTNAPELKPGRFSHPEPDDHVPPSPALMGRLLGMAPPSVTPERQAHAVTPAPALQAPVGAELLAHFAEQLQKDPALGPLLVEAVRGDPALASKVSLLSAAARK